MQKKFLCFVVTVIATMLFIPVAFAQEAPRYDKLTTTEGGKEKQSELFFANGTPITISARDDGEEGALISWDGGSQVVSPNVTVFGAGHEEDAIYETTSITMNGGKVRNLFGGGLHKSHVVTANIVVNGGTVTGGIQGGGAASLLHCHGTYYAGDPKNSPTVVEKANVIVNKMEEKGYTVYGGGEGISYTGSTNVKVIEGSWDYVIAGGSNGYTGDATLEVLGGTIGVVQSVNRGSMDSADIEISGGTITSAYVGGEPDAGVTGTIGAANMSIVGGTVTNVAVGTNGGQNIPATDVATLMYKEEVVENIDTSGFKQENIVTTVSVTINIMGVTETVEIPKGAVLTDEEIEELQNIDLEELGLTGYLFKGYYQDADFKTPYDFTKAFDQDTTIYMQLEEIKEEPPVENPDTGDINLMIIAGLTILGLAGTVCVTKKVLHKN